jgi:hypothetical protein
VGGADPAGRAEPVLEDRRTVSEQIDDGDLTQSLTARFGNRGADLADGEANWLVPQDVAGAGETEGTVAPPRPDEPQAFESRFARNGRGAPSGEVPPLKAQSGQTGKGDAAPLIIPAQEVGPLSAKGGPHGTGGIGDQEVHQGHVVDPTLGQPVAGSLGGVGHTGGHRLDLDSSGAYVAAPVDEEAPPTVFSKRHAASDGDDAETWDESEQAHTLNQNMNAPDVAADAQAVRRLTPTEAERLQGVPDGWSLPYGPSLADAPAWHDLRNPPLPVRAVTINEGNDTPQGSVWESDQCGSLATGGGKPGQGYHAVRTEPADPTWIGLDNANRGNDHVREGQPSAEALRAKGTLDQAVCFHADALGRDGEAKTDSPDAEGRMRKRDAGTGIAQDESYNLTTGAPHAVGYSSPPLTAAGFHGNADGSDDQVEATALAFEARYYSDRERMGGAPSGEAGPVKATDSKAGDAAQVVAFSAMAQGGQGWAPNSIATSEDEAHTIDTTRAQAVAFEPRYYNREHDTGGPGTPPSGETLPPLKAQSGQGDGAPHVAFAQNQRDEVRELDQASSLSGPGTHQTTYVAGTAVAAGLACPYDCPPDGPRYAALGDAVTAPVARWIGERLVDVLRERGVIAADGAVDLGADLG